MELEVIPESRQVHIFWNGQSWDFDFDTLDVGMLSTDAEIRAKVAEAVDAPVIKLANFNVERNETTQDITLRANNVVFG